MPHYSHLVARMNQWKGFGRTSILGAWWFSVVWTRRSSIFPKHPFRQVSVLLFIHFFRSAWNWINSSEMLLNHTGTHRPALARVAPDWSSKGLLFCLIYSKSPLRGKDKCRRCHRLPSVWGWPRTLSNILTFFKHIEEGRFLGPIRKLAKCVFQWVHTDGSIFAAVILGLKSSSLLY